VRQVPGGVVAVATGIDKATGLRIQRKAFVPYAAVANTPGEVSGLEVGRFGRRLVNAAKKVAKNKAVRGVVKAAWGVAKLTPYGAAANAAIGAAKGVVNAARGRTGSGQRGRSRGGAPVRARGRGAPRGGSALTPVVRIDPIVARILRARIGAGSKVRILRQLGGI